MNKEDKFYRDKKKDAELYAKLQDITARFVELEALLEVTHSMDTCVNESFNNTITWLAPKNKVYAGTGSLINRISISIGINSLGILAYYQELFVNFGITMTPDVHHFLSVKDRSKRKRINNTKTTAFKHKSQVRILNLFCFPLSLPSC